MTGMPDRDAIHTKSADIGYSTLSFQGELKIVSIMNFLQDAASEHASAMGVSGFDLAKENLAWVISRYQIEIKKTPSWKDEIQIETWRTPIKNLYELRQFRIVNSNDIEIVTARACWVMIKKASNRPVRLSRYLPEKYLGENITSSMDIFHDLKKPVNIDFELPFRIRLQDLDLNAHVNNAIYVGWAVETVPEDFYRKQRPEHIDVVFHKESLYGETILSRTQIIVKGKNFQTLHTILGSNGTIELARINILWRSKTAGD